MTLDGETEVDQHLKSKLKMCNFAFLLLQLP